MIVRCVKIYTTKMFWNIAILFVLFTVNAEANTAVDQKVSHVVIISVDGLRPDAITVLGKQYAPSFYYLMSNGAFTLNARTDPDWTITMPNHVSMLTGRGVMGPQGHGYTDNRQVNKSIHDNKGYYVSSVFDVVKLNHGTSAFIATKEKFNVFINSYAKADDVHPYSRIDRYWIVDNDDRAVREFLKMMRESMPTLTFLHLSLPDKTGHAQGWDLHTGSRYLNAVMVIDRLLNKIIKAIENNLRLVNSTVVILTSDHGGSVMNHQDHTKKEHFRIPFIIWGKGVARGVDLYKINTAIRQDPLDKQLSFDVAGQPIRNADAANLALSFLGLTPIQGSTVGNPEVINVVVEKK